MTKAQDTAFAAMWQATRAGAVEQIGGDGRRIVESHEAAWARTRAGTVGGSLPPAPKSLRRPKKAAVGQPAQPNVL